MDYMKFVNYHRETNADITIGCIAYGSDRAKEFGLMKIDEKRRVTVRARDRAAFGAHQAPPPTASARSPSQAGWRCAPWDMRVHHRLPCLPVRAIPPCPAPLPRRCLVPPNSRSRRSPRPRRRWTP